MKLMPGSLHSSRQSSFDGMDRYPLYFFTRKEDFSVRVFMELERKLEYLKAPMQHSCSGALKAHF